VGAHGHQVDRAGVHVDGRLAERLGGIAVEQYAHVEAERGDIGDRLQHADFVVGVHHAHQQGLGANGRAQATEIEQAIGEGRQHGGGIAQAFQVAHGVEHGGVLGGHGDDVVAFGTVGLGHAFYGQVVGFRGPAGEHDVARLGAGERGHAFAGELHGLLGFPAEAVAAAGGIAELGSQEREHSR
jgi:hypothetical protein